MTKITFFIFQQHSLFIPLKVFHPEAYYITERHNEEHPLACFTHPSVVNAVLVEPLARKLNYVFEELWPKLTPKLPKERKIYLYYKYPNKPNSIQSGVFSFPLEDPKVIIMNPFSFKKFSKEGVIYEWEPPTDFLLLGSDNKVLT